MAVSMTPERENKSLAAATSGQELLDILGREHAAAGPDFAIDRKGRRHHDAASHDVIHFLDLDDLGIQAETIDGLPGRAFERFTLCAPGAEDFDLPDSHGFSFV
jgi:hypothetical protein